jgi:hypothetical protein
MTRYHGEKVSKGPQVRRSFTHWSVRRVRGRHFDNGPMKEVGSAGSNLRLKPTSSFPRLNKSTGPSAARHRVGLPGLTDEGREDSKRSERSDKEEIQGPT